MQLRRYVVQVNPRNVAALGLPLLPHRHPTQDPLQAYIEMRFYRGGLVVANLLQADPEKRMTAAEA